MTSRPHAVKNNRRVCLDYDINRRYLCIFANNSTSFITRLSWLRNRYCFVTSIRFHITHLHLFKWCLRNALKNYATIRPCYHILTDLLTFSNVFSSLYKLRSFCSKQRTKNFLVRWWKLRKDITQVALKSRLTKLLIDSNSHSLREIYSAAKSILLSLTKKLFDSNLNNPKISLQDLNSLVLKVSLETSLYSSKSITKSGIYSIELNKNIKCIY